MLQSENLAGLYVIPSYASSLEWFGVLFVRDDGIYKDGVFRFRLLLHKTFPEDSTAVPVSAFIRTFHLPSCSTFPHFRR